MILKEANWEYIESRIHPSKVGILRKYQQFGRDECIISLINDPPDTQLYSKRGSIFK